MIKWWDYVYLFRTYDKKPTWGIERSKRWRGVHVLLGHYQLMLALGKRW